MLGKQAKIVSPTTLRRMLVYARRTRQPKRDTVIVLLSVKAGLRACEIAGLQDRFERLTKNKRHMARKRANEVSYLFDSFIEEIIWRSELPVFAAGLNIKLEHFEKAVRVIAQEPRFKRRLLGELFVSLRSTKWDRPTARFAYLKEEPDNICVFTAEPRRGTQPLAQRDENPRAFLYQSCFRAPRFAPNAKHVVGIHVGEPGPGAAGALFYMDMTDPQIVVRTTEQKVAQDTPF